jgi:hypothetical protein
LFELGVYLLTTRKTVHRETSTSRSQAPDGEANTLNSITSSAQASRVVGP